MAVIFGLSTLNSLLVYRSYYHQVINHFECPRLQKAFTGGHYSFLFPPEDPGEFASKTLTFSKSAILYSLSQHSDLHLILIAKVPMKKVKEEWKGGGCTQRRDTATEPGLWKLMRRRDKEEGSPKSTIWNRYCKTENQFDIFFFFKS